MMSVTLADNEKRTKERIVTVSKDSVLKDIDLVTHKHVDGSMAQNVQVRNALESDSAEGVDGAVLARYVEFRDARLRFRLQRYLAPTDKESATDSINPFESEYVYNLVVDASFNDNTLRPLAEYIHRYLQYGALQDWYEQFEDKHRQAAYYGQLAAQMEDDIVTALSGPAIVKKPLQPFGPAKYPR